MRTWAMAHHRVMELKESTQTFSFEGFSSEPVISALRGFLLSSTQNGQSQDDLISLMGAITIRIEMGRVSALHMPQSIEALKP